MPVSKVKAMTEDEMFKIMRSGKRYSGFFLVFSSAVFHGELRVLFGVLDVMLSGISGRVL